MSCILNAARENVNSKKSRVGLFESERRTYININETSGKIASRNNYILIGNYSLQAVNLSTRYISLYFTIIFVDDDH